MLVLDYIQKLGPDADAAALLVPSFHTGHLGFVPGSPVRVGVLAATGKEERHCEAVVTRFDKDWRDLGLLSVALRNERGVVARLMEAIAALGINIGIQESSSVNALNEHTANLLLDFSTATSLPIGISPPPVQRLYREYRGVFPIHDLRYVALFDSIVAHCADVLLWKPVSGELFPDLELRPMAELKFSEEGNETIQPAQGLKVQIPLPARVLAEISRRLKNPPELVYVLVSDASGRSLRASFLDPATSRSLYHVGVYHTDQPGALAAIVECFRAARFSILTSLVRKTSDMEAVWEAILVDEAGEEGPPGGGEPAHRPVTHEVLSWIADRLVADGSRSWLHAAAGFGVRLDAPRYPPQHEVESVWLHERLTNLPMPGAPPSSGGWDPQVVAALIGERERAIEEAKETGKLKPEYAERARTLLNVVRTQYTTRALPKVFLSYPKTAHLHATVLLDKLPPTRYDVGVYQEPLGGEDIAETAIEQIEDCDCFVAIWHPDSGPPRGEVFTTDVSGWLHLEYGVALTSRKPAVVAYSEQLHESVWRRIKPGEGKLGYSDVEFATKTVGKIVAFCERVLYGEY